MSIRIGYEHPDRLRTSGYLNILSGCMVPIRMHGSYPDTWFLSGCLHGVIHRAAIHYRLYPQATV